jgi:hypothetical protein
MQRLSSIIRVKFCKEGIFVAILKSFIFPTKIKEKVSRGLLLLFQSKSKNKLATNVRSISAVLGFSGLGSSYFRTANIS